MQAHGYSIRNSGRKPTSELIAIIAVGVAVLGQSAWLDGKIERVTRARPKFETDWLQSKHALPTLQTSRKPRRRSNATISVPPVEA